ncbi:MAG: 7-cyano-7-deazaguanine synthase QueC [Deltaproteobacteria bacterium]|nr:7-cyano-7-deazaguanine synthase QueC [Deltaproteobacteria bacterium]
MKIVLVYSGGLDSTTLLFYLRRQGHEVRCLSIDYGQRHCREIESARSICCLIGQELRVLDISQVGGLFGESALVDRNVPLPQGKYQLENMKVTIVPNRNMVFLSLAIAWAISTRSEAVAYAAHAGDRAVYPDCRPEFVADMDSVAKQCDWSSIDVIAPFIDKSKVDIVLLAASLGVPFEKTWSCYAGGEVHCGLCATCLERKEAFIGTGLVDGVQYAN